MTHKEENIVNIAMRAGELLAAGKIERDDITGHAGLTDTIISLAEDFEKRNEGVDYDAADRDYWIEIDAFAEEQLLERYGIEQNRESGLTVFTAPETPVCEVLAVFGNADPFTLIHGTWDECKQFCEENGWSYWDEHNFRWELEISDAREATFPVGFHTAVAHYCDLTGEDIDTDFVRQHAGTLVSCYENNLTFGDFEAWSKCENVLGQRLSLAVYLDIEENYDIFSFEDPAYTPFVDEIKGRLAEARSSSGTVFGKASLDDIIHSASKRTSQERPGREENIVNNDLSR